MPIEIKDNRSLFNSDPNQEKRYVGDCLGGLVLSGVVLFYSGGWLE